MNPRSTDRLNGVAGWSDGLERGGDELLAGRISVHGHDQVRLGEQGAQDVDDAVGAAECAAVGVRAADADCRRAQSEGFDDVGAAADTGVEEDRQTVGGLDDGGQGVEGGKAAVGLPATPASRTRRTSSGWQMPFTISGRSVRERSQPRSSQVSGLPKIWVQWRIAACGSSSGGRPRPARKAGSLV